MSWRPVLAWAAVLCVAPVAHAATPECLRVQVHLDAGLNAAVVERDWASGRAQTAAPAVLELSGCDGRVLDRMALAAPLARVDPVPVQRTAAPTWLVSVDLTAEAGSYNGPLTTPVQVVGHRLAVVTACDRARRCAPVQLALTGKASWRRVPRPGGREAFLSVASIRQGGGFQTIYARYAPPLPSHPGPWRLRARTQAGLWEADAPFPPVTRFP